jgi:guanylate kinase
MLGITLNSIYGFHHRLLLSLIYPITITSFSTMTMHDEGKILTPKTAADAKLMVIAGPSGTGKSTLLKRLFDNYSDRFGFSVSHTTRIPRLGEQHGVHYHFTDHSSMKRDIDEGKFIEHAVYSGHLYGTSVQAAMSVLEQGKVCILDIDMQGVKSIKNIPSLASRAHYIFIMPPSLDSLEERLRSRNSETTESIKQRMEIAKEEIAYAFLPGSYDHIIVNDTLEEAYTLLRDIALQHL